jgi:hypothetical protein
MASTYLAAAEISAQQRAAVMRDLVRRIGEFKSADTLNMSRATHVPGDPQRDLI